MTGFRLFHRACCLALLLAGVPAVAEAPIVELAQGAVRGASDQGVLAFKGIPYAASPVGDLRWRPPAAPGAWQGVRDATQFAPDCPGAFPDRARMDEDCLYLNLWTAGTEPAARRPVMVWIYGGGFRGGSAAAPLFDGAALARKGVVLVSFAYRTGSLGFLATPELSRESEQGVSGNYGILDAIAALRWVRDNIARFGGDPGNVTIFGQSSGSETVNILTASPLAKGLFHRAIGESGSSFGVRAALPLEDAEAAGAAFVARVGGGGPAELRAMPWQELLELDTEKLEPNVDGWLLPRSVRETYLAGAQNDVPMLIGNTAQEFPRPPEVTRADLERDLAAYEPSVAAIARELDQADPTDARWRLTNAEWGDFPAATWARLQAATGKAPAYRYLFDYAPPQPAGQPRIARHGSELAYVFGSYSREGHPEIEPAEQLLGELLPAYWINFARTGDPNLPGLPQWQPQSRAPGSYLRFSGKGAAQEPMRDAALIDALEQFHHQDGY